MTKTAFLRPRSAPAESLESLAGLLREWLPLQRWFAGKDRPVTDLGVLSTTELFPGCLHVLVHAAQAAVPAPGGTTPATATSCCSGYASGPRPAWARRSSAPYGTACSPG